MRIQNFLKIILLSLFSLFLISCAGTRAQESTGQYLDNSVVTAKVKTALIKEEKLKALNIQVSTYKGTVQLSGFVSTPEQRNKAEIITKNVSGVQTVKNDLILKR